MNRENRLLIRIVSAILVVMSLVMPLLAEFQPATPDYKFSFPKDHGAHPDFQTEWWYFTGHLETKAAGTFGFQLTFFRVANPLAQNSDNPWAYKDILVSHFALTDSEQEKFYFSELSHRSGQESAGVSESGLKLTLFNSAITQSGGELIKLAAINQRDGVQLKLDLFPQKPLVLHGDAGYSQKGSDPANASLYMAYTRLAGAGELKIGSETHQILQADAWMDHEVMSSKLPFGLAGWDWFALQLSDGRDLVLYQVRSDDPQQSKYNYAAFISKAGELEIISSDKFKIKILSNWRSEATDKRYPASWQLDLPQESFIVTPVMKNQEIISKTTDKTYWEGRSTVECLRDNKKLPCGNAYVELVGY